MAEAFALELYRRFVNGESILDLSRDLGIPAERIRRRLEAAAVFVSNTGAAQNRF